MNVTQISFFFDPDRTAEQILQDWWGLVDGAEMPAHAGATVSVIQACRESKVLVRNQVSYHFLPPVRGYPSIVDTPEFGRLLPALKADVFHVQGLAFGADVLALDKLAPDTPIFLQDHAEKLPRFWRRRAFRRGVSVAKGISFCSLEQAQPFVKAGLFHPRTVLSAIPECSSRFTPGDREDARRLTGVQGDPAVLWVGHLDSNKDPLTVLSGIGAAARRLPGLQLWCCFATAPLMAEVRARIEADPHLQGRVHLIGRVGHEKVEHLMRAADLFVSGSWREGSGFSLIEALACGLPTVVTDIPSFRSLTGGGITGSLWPCGESTALGEAVVSVAARPRIPLREAVRAYFEREVSFAAVGRKMLAAYKALPRSTDSGVGERLLAAK
jgi:glycosyltransferase involved in cell wall biosynthesis